MDQNTELAVMTNQATALVVVLVCFVVTRMRKVYAQVEAIPYGPRTESDQHRQRTLHMIYNYNDVECIGMLRMGRAPFFTLCNLLRTRGLVPKTNGFSVGEQVAMFLHFVNHN
jgi:hypothetical protein